MAFSPFGESSTDALTASDLAQLAQSPEGWFLEYKREPCKASDYGKEASAFANSQGGWIFVGLGEDAGTRMPTQGPGIPRADALRVLDAARDGIVHNVSPAPRIELKIVDGPIPALAMANDRAVPVIRVPESRDTPHIHSSGRIYRRQADAAHPIEDRAELDALNSRRTQLRDFLDEQLSIGFDEQWAGGIDTPWVHVALVPHPARGPRSNPMKFAQFHDVLARSNSGAIALPDIYPSALGYVARNHRHQEVPNGAATTLEYGHGGAFYMTMPLSCGRVVGSELPPFLGGEHGIQFLSLLQEKGFDYAQVIDGSSLASCLYGMERHMQCILETVGGPDEYFGRVGIWNVFRRVPFFESAAYLEWCTRNSVPVIHRNQFQIPWPKKQWFVVDDIRSFNAPMTALVKVLLALGVDDRILSRVASDTISSLAARERSREDA